MGTVEVALVLGSLSGTLSSSYLLEALDYSYSFGICALVAFISVLYTNFYLQETVDLSESNVRTKFR